VNTLTFELSDGTDGLATLQAMASSRSAAQHEAALAQAQRLLDWALGQALRHGPIDEGNDWDHDLHVGLEAGGWWVLTLTITGAPPFIDELMATMGVDT
jgi:hypothetical protein